MFHLPRSLWLHNMKHHPPHLNPNWNYEHKTVLTKKLTSITINKIKFQELNVTLDKPPEPSPEEEAAPPPPETPDGEDAEREEGNFHVLHSQAAAAAVAAFGSLMLILRRSHCTYVPPPTLNLSTTFYELASYRNQYQLTLSVFCVSSSYLFLQLFKF